MVGELQNAKLRFSYLSGSERGARIGSIRLIFHAANFSLGLSPALDANRTSMSKLN